MLTVVFGCGGVGMQTIQFVGEDKVDYLCDNNGEFVGKKIRDKLVINYESLLNLYREKNVLIIIGLNSFNAEKVAEQLIRDEIYDFVVVGMLPEFPNKKLDDKLFCSLGDKEQRLEFANKYLCKRISDEKEQNNYLKRHMDIRKMRPAIGEQRRTQLALVRTVEQVLDFLEKNCKIECWITGGTLIGKMRHNGFIPWDTDIDFGIMRESIYELIRFFENYSAVVILGKCSKKLHLGSSTIEWYDDLEVATKKYKNKYVLQIACDYLRICNIENDKINIALELFPFDFYCEDFTIEQYHEYVSEAFMMKKVFSSDSKWFDYCYNRIQNSGFVSKNPTSKILPGIDSFIYRGLWNIEDFIPYDAVYPLKEIDFEGVKMKCVNNPIRYMEHEYPDWENFPDRIMVKEESY